MANDPAIEAIEQFISSQNIDTSAKEWRLKLEQPPCASFDANTSYFWDIETNVGSLSVELMPKIAPMHVSSLIYLASLGFYDGLSFHRVIKGFMAQGGCPRGTGTGGPGYQFDGEFDASVRHDASGLLSMANAGPGTDGSQFFLTFVPTDWLDDKHTIFGKVVDGHDTLRALEARGSQSGATTEPLSMIETRIRTS